MVKQLNYDTVCLIELYLEEAQKELDLDIFRLERHAPESDRLFGLHKDKEALKAAIEELSAHGTYIANYGKVSGIPSKP